MKGPLYLARRSYRRRRVRDGSRFLPVLGVVLMVAPVSWGADGARSLARDAIWLFGVWAGLILAALWLSRHLTDEPDDPAGADGER